MKKVLKSCLLALVIIPCLFLLSACGGANKNQVYNANFSKNAGNVFTDMYGTVTYNSEYKTVKLGKDSKYDNSANTYFGEEDKNFDWIAGGLTVNAKFKIFANDYDDNQGFNWTISLNGEDGNFITERSVYVRKYDTGVKVGYTENGSSNDINLDATSNDEAVLLPDGWYTFSFKFYENENNEIKLNISVINVYDETVFEHKNAGLGKSDGVNVTKDEVKGLRYGWLSWMTVDSLECSEISIYKNA